MREYWRWHLANRTTGTVSRTPFVVHQKRQLRWFCTSDAGRPRLCHRLNGRRGNGAPPLPPERHPTSPRGGSSFAGMGSPATVAAFMSANLTTSCSPPKPQFAAGTQARHRCLVSSSRMLKHGLLFVSPAPDRGFSCPRPLRRGSRTPVGW